LRQAISRAGGQIYADLSRINLTNASRRIRYRAYDWSGRYFRNRECILLFIFCETRWKSFRIFVWSAEI